MDNYAQERVSALGLLGDRLCLDFANTTGSHPSHGDNEFLTHYERLIDWSVYTSVLTPNEAELLLNRAQQDAAAAEVVLNEAVMLREAMYRIFAANAAEARPDARDMALFNRAVAEAGGHLAVVPAADHFHWHFTGAVDDLRRMLYPVVWSAAQLMVSDDLQYVRECAGDGCNWLFMDTSKNHTRRWCSMSSCGNRAKARSHYRRKKSGE
jgi:predicted RNA-binding Zn ribbon-like protein